MLTAAALSILTGCTGGGGGGGGGGAGGTSVPAIVDFLLGTGGVPVTIEYPGGVVDVGVNLTGFYRVNRDDWANDVGTALSMDTGALFGVLDLTITSRMAGDAWERPTMGVVDVCQPSTGDRILVEVNAAAGGVDIYYDDGGDGLNVIGPFTYSWEDLYDLFGSSPAEYEEIASFAMSVLELIQERFLIVYQVFVSVFELQEFLEGIGPEMQVEIPDGCQTLPGGNFGDGRFVWHDVNLDGLVNTGDSFTVTVEDCWVDTSGRFDPLFDGTIELTNFAFGQSPFGTGADIEFDDLEEVITEELGGVYSILPGTETTTRGDSDVDFSKH